MRIFIVVKPLPALFFSLLFSLSCSFSFGQNLVPNWSFEDTITCGQFVSNATGWVNCRATPDYCSVCNNQAMPAFGVPLNGTGYQLPATGNAYGRICTYACNQLYREMIGISLFQPLVIGNSYYVSFKCSPGSPDQGYCVQTDKLGLRFSTISYDSASPPPINNFAHVYTDSVVSDTAGWTNISGYFTADSAYTFLTISNFFDDANTDTLDPFGCSCWAMYYIDDVVVSDSITGINEITKQKNRLKLSQMGNQLSIELFEGGIYAVMLYDYTGRLAVSYSGTGKQRERIDISSLRTGIYIAAVQTQNNTETKKCLIINN